MYKYVVVGSGSIIYNTQDLSEGEMCCGKN